MNLPFNFQREKRSLICFHFFQRDPFLQDLMLACIRMWQKRHWRLSSEVGTFRALALLCVTAKCSYSPLAGS